MRASSQEQSKSYLTYRERHPLRAELERKEFARDDPGNGSPCGGKEGLHRQGLVSIKSDGAGTEKEAYNVNADHCDEHLLASNVAYGDGSAYDCDNVFAKTHADGTYEKQTPSAVALDTPDARHRH